jgi:glutamyl-tRNA(Gln) amidotransferase subunit D
MMKVAENPSKWGYNKHNKLPIYIRCCDQMSYPQGIRDILKSARIEVGDTIEVITSKGAYSGILMPHHEFSQNDILTIKLDSGYNIGLKVGENVSLKLLSKGESGGQKTHKTTDSQSKSTISILGTGGTIASYVDYRTGAVHPAKSAEDLAYSIPELAAMCNLETKVMFSIFSEDMKIKHWQKIAAQAADDLNSRARGVIIPHGTDTMGYTGAALSFMMSNLSGPVILVGAQRSSDRPSTDANLNLISAASVALDTNLGEVVVLMHKDTSDTEIAIHRGTRVRKMHTSRRDAFHSINEEPMGMISNNKVSITEPYRKRSKKKVNVRGRMEERVSILYSYPGISVDHFDYLAQNNRGIVIAGSGLGHTPRELIGSIENAVAQGIVVVMTSQCLYGRVNMNVYSTGRDLLKAGVIAGEDMLPETAYMKLMWVLGQTENPHEIRELMQRDLVGEISERRTR